MQILAIIQARGGSKGVPRKNLLPLGGKPLIAWTIAAARGTATPMRVVVSTDDPAIAGVARMAGAEVPFLRPDELATDSVGSLPVLQHALRWLDERERYRPDVVVQLKPTNPLRTAATIDAGVALYLARDGLDSVLSVSETHDHPFKTWTVDGTGLLVPFLPESFTGMKDAGRQPRQSLPRAYRHNSAVNVIRSATIHGKGSLQGDRILPFVTDDVEGFNIDTLLDFAVVEVLMRERSKAPI